MLQALAALDDASLVTVAALEGARGSPEKGLAHWKMQDGIPRDSKKERLGSLGTPRDSKKEVIGIPRDFKREMIGIPRDP